MPKIEFISSLNDSFFQSAIKAQKSVVDISKVYDKIEDKSRLVESIKRYKEHNFNGEDLEGFNMDAFLLFESLEVHFQKCIDDLKKMRSSIMDSKKKINGRKKILKEIDVEIVNFEAKKKEAFDSKKAFQK